MGSELNEYQPPKFQAVLPIRPESAAQSLVRPDRVVITVDIFTKQICKMLFIKRDNMIKQFPAKDADSPLADSVLPGRMVSGSN